MPFPFDREQLSDEVRAMVRVNEAARSPGVEPFPPSSLVLQLPKGAFRLPSILDKTAPPELAAEFEELLGVLREVHERHLGERVLDVAAYYSVTGAGALQEERLRSWAERYFRFRTAPYLESPARHGDPFLLFERLVGESEAIFGPLGRADNAVTPVFLGLMFDYAPWLLYTRLWRDKVRRVGGVWELTYSPAEPGIVGRLACWLKATRWHEDHLARFLRRLAEAFRDELPEQVATEDAHALRQRLGFLTARCQSMRSSLQRDAAPHETVILLGGNLAAAWYWGPRRGLAGLLTAPTVEAIREKGHRFVTEDPIAVGYDGVLCDFFRPWLTAIDCEPVSGSHPLMLNLHLIERFHVKLASLLERYSTG